MVTRGGRVDLRTALRLKPSAECRISNVVGNGSSCGAVSPNIFTCSYSGEILYQHYGCFADRELATFIVSTTKSAGFGKTEAKASIVSIEVIVGPPHPLLAKFLLDTVPASDNLENGAINLTVVFPSAMVGHCYYEVLNGWPRLPFPLAGRLEGAVNQLLPSGYVPRSALTYVPNINSIQPHTNYLLVKIYAHQLVGNSTLQQSYVILPFWTHLERPQDNETRVGELNRDFLIIHQAVHTPLSTSDLNLPTSASIGSQQGSLSQPNPLPVVRYSFPVLKTGSFRSLYSTSTNVTRSVFTVHDFVAGHVSFHPTDHHSSTTPAVYRYNVTNLAGSLLATGEVSVLVRERNADRPSHRRNLPLSVAEGGTAVIDHTTIDFYLLETCERLAELQVLRAPSHGELRYQNGSRIGKEEILLWVLHNTTLLRYHHLGGEEPGDVIYWRIKCLESELRVFMSVLVVPVDDAPPTIRVRSRLLTHEGWASPLSPSSLQVEDADTCLQDIQLTAGQFSGTLFRSFNGITRNSSHLLYPLMTKSSLISLLGAVELSEVLTFSVGDLEQQRGVV